MHPGLIVKALRRADGTRQRELAATVGLSQSFLANVERGYRDLPVARREPVAEALGVPVAVVLGASPVLAHLRQRLNVTVADLALAVGITPKIVGELESGVRKPSPDVAERLAHRLGADPAVFTPEETP